MKRVALYMRVSTDRQAQEGDSIPAQRNALQKYVRERPEMVIAGEYIDGGISGTKADRDELQRLLDDVRERKIDQILFTKLDRWFRSVRHYTATQELLDQYGVTWTAIWEAMYDTSTPSGRLIVNQMQSIAQYEAENTSLRIRQVFAYKLSKNEVTSGKQPFGFSIVNKHIVPNADAETVRKVFLYYSQTGNLYQTRSYAASIGYDRHLKPLKQMLQNRKYIGEYKGNPDYCPAVVDRNLFFDVQRKLDMNVKESTTVTYVFSGLIRCGICGRRMSGRHTKWTSKEGVTRICSYYRCPGVYVNWKKDCENRHTPSEKKVEEFLLENIKSAAKSYVATIESAAPQDNTRRIEELKKKLSRLTDLYVESYISMDEYTRRKDEYTRELSALEDKEKRAVRSPVSTIISFDFDSMYKSFTKEEKRLFWRNMLSSISVYTDGHMEMQFIE